MTSKKLAIAADHLGLPLKDAVKTHLLAKGVEIEDLGVNDADPVDYPDVGRDLAKRIQAGDFERGILVCGTGAGMAIVAN